MRDISEWFEAKSTEQDSARIRRHLDNLMSRLKRTAPARRHEEVAPGAGRTVPDPEHPNEPFNS